VRGKDKYKWCAEKDLEGSVHMGKLRKTMENLSA
jgi:hypothetical protein